MSEKQELKGSQVVNEVPCSGEALRRLKISETKKRQMSLYSAPKGYAVTVKWRKKNPVKSWACDSIYRHKRSGYIVKLSSTSLAEMASHVKICPLCGRKLNWDILHKGRGNLLAPSLDRVNNEPVITRNNIIVICRKCNFAKGQMTLREFVDYCKIVAQYDVNERSSEESL